MLKSYVFDLDQNIVHTKTPVYLLVKQPDASRQEEAVPNADFDIRMQDTEHVRLHDDFDYSMREFRWYGKLIKDVFEAIDDKRFGPSWDKFVTATIEAAPAHIVTARGNPQQEFAEMHKKIIYEVLTQSQREEMDYNMRNHLRDRTHSVEWIINLYLSNNLYIPCANDEIVKAFRWWKKRTGEKKALAFEKCIKKTITTYTSYYGKEFMKNRHISIWFSDDSKKNIDAVTQQIIETSVEKHPNISFMLYNTQEPKIIRKESIHRKSASKPLF